ncbi:PDGLE domain-containing protein [Patescibacteria group bacterium]
MQKKKLIILLILSVFIGLALSFFASPSPDGLERIAENHCFIESAISFWNGLMPDYTFLGIENEWLAVGLAGLIGTMATFLVLYGLTFVFVKVQK